MKALQKIVLLTSGGDAPGMNAAIRAVVRTALYHGIAVYGSESGFEGLVQQKLIPLDSRFVANCIQRGGTILKTGRSNAFQQKATRDQVRQFLTAQHVDGLIVLGGNGSFQGAKYLYQEGGPKVIGIPCTIDNDIHGTDYCIGFDTACNTALQAIDKIRDTAFSLERSFLIEVMGRSSGFIAMHVGIAGGAEIILTPEFPLSLDELTTKIQQQHGKKLASIIVVAEADQPGHSFALAEQIKQKTGIEYRVCVLGHTQRGGTPTVKDRVMGSRMGAEAVEALRQGASAKMMAVQQGQVTLADFPTQTIRYCNDEHLLQLNQRICEI
ncbi:MAG: 6-phosphofructokinase [Coxiella sp. RIFCSPHIGHO2_12_FULL_44_14]|nr:MAG: 6-phosphofructokinase [Coxiella sp. RIFCSPHIGHO2_12_FULL_44_14]